MIHPTAIVECKSIPESTNVWAYAHVMNGAQIGRNCNLGDHSFVEGGAIVGDGCTIKNQVCIWNGVEIQDGVFVGPGVIFTNDRFPRSPRMELMQERYESEAWLSRTRVETGCSIGAGAVICPGISLGSYSMIGAGSVVTRDVPPFALVVGNPARVIGKVCKRGHVVKQNQQQQAGESGGCGASTSPSIATTPQLPNFTFHTSENENHD